MDKNIETFLNQLIDEKGYADLDTEIRQEMINNLAEQLYNQIDAAVARALPEEKALELSKRLENSEMSDEELTKFVTDSGVDYEKIVLETMLEFRILFTSPTPNQTQTEA